MSKRLIVIEIDEHHVSLIIRDGDGKLIDEIEGTAAAAMESSIIAAVLDCYREVTR